MTQRPSTRIWVEMADLIKCDIPTIKAVFEVEAAGKFYESNGKLPQRFEPHHFPKKHWTALGFAPGNQAPWRASLKLRTSERKRMFDLAETIDAEATYDATSWGAPQIMGFNSKLAGYPTAVEMVDAFEQSADNQIRAFVSFVIESDLDGFLRAQDWHGFASGYNGDGQAAVYAGRIESAYRRQSGGRASATVLRLGSTGDAVRQLQEQLSALGHVVPVDGDFGGKTLAAVKAFQEANGLKVDGVVGATTQKAIVEAGGRQIEPPKAELTPTSTDAIVDKVIERGTAVVGTGGLAGLLGGLDDTAQQLLIGGVVVGGLVIAVLFFLRRKNA